MLKKKKLNGSSRTLILLILTIVIVAIAVLVFYFFKVKSIYNSVSSGQKNLTYALELASNRDFSQAKNYSSSAKKDFTFSRETIFDLQKNKLIKKIKYFDENLSDFLYLAQAAEILGDSAERALSLLSEIEDLLAGERNKNFLDFSDEDKARVLKLMYESYPEMQGIKANLDLSLIYLAKGADNKFLSSYTSQIKSLEGQIKNISESLKKIIPFLSIIPDISGYPQEKSYLIVLQNNNELRPTGGFIGSYGILTMSLGDFKKIETHDIYHLDMPASLNKDFFVEAPVVIKKYLGPQQWFMRDANWSPDWSSSAQKILWFYQEEMKAANRSSDSINFDGVIAINPRFITDLLYLTGPLEIDGQVYDKDNFIDVLQYEVEMDFREEGISEWDRKLVIGRILDEMKNKLFELPADRWLELLNTFEQNIIRKNILVYLENDYSRNLSADLDWGGDIKNAWLDYLMVVDANMAAFKTDRVMDKRITYKLKEEPDGRFKARLELKYKNNGWFDWQTTRYRSFTRLYVPVGSSFLGFSGFSQDSLEQGREDSIAFPKNYWGAFMSIEPKEEKVFVFEYYLPQDFSDKINEDKKYFLRVQRQSGSSIEKFSAELEFSQAITKAKGLGDLEIEENKVYWSNSLDQDYDLELNF